MCVFVRLFGFLDSIHGTLGTGWAQARSDLIGWLHSTAILTGWQAHKHGPF